MIDEMSGFADLLAILIEKYASELDVDNLPAPLFPHGSTSVAWRLGQYGSR